MSTQVSQLDVDCVAVQYGLSRRGAYNMIHRDIWGLRAKQFADPWSTTNLDGAINLRLAENNILHDEVAEFIHTKLLVQGVQHLTYSTGPRGSFRLRKAAAIFLETEFASLLPITEDDIFITPGLTSAVDAITWAICNEGDGVLIPRPFYNGFKIDIQHRTGAVVVEANFFDLEGYSCIDDVFDPLLNRKCLERAFSKAQAEGINIRAVLIANPHNPLGRCYSIEALREIASFCGKRGCHFISDEIYARSCFGNPRLLDPPSFTSTLSVDLTEYIDPQMHHVLYGASKDFCANGLRLGLVYSKNKGILGAMSSISPFSWSPHVLQDVWASMLEDEEWRRQFFAKNMKLMAKRYHLATQILREAGIRYYEMNAGVYIWVDLRPYFLSKKSSNNDLGYTSLRILSTTSTTCNEHADRESQIIDICARNGVHIAPGSSYRAEEYGWFRVTFTTTEAALREALRRMLTSLTQLKEVDRATNL